MLIRLLVVAVIVGACAGRAQADGWTKGSDEAGRQVWILESTSGTGASVLVGCEHPAISIRTKVSLLEMADDDGEIVVSFLSSASETREKVDGWLVADSHGVRFKEVANRKIANWLRRRENVGRELTFVLSNNDRKELYIFNNTSRVCEDPKRQKPKE
jgi:hypothetical protein